MKAVFSTTFDDKYLFFAPLAAWSWRKIGVGSIIFYPQGTSDKLSLVKEYTDAMWCPFQCKDFQVATYAQCSRLFGAALNLPSDEMLITADVDMAVFGDYLLQGEGQVNVFGSDLTDADQFPMCYISAPVRLWRQIMGIKMFYRHHLSALIDHLESENLRGTHWCLDQNTAFQHINNHNGDVNLYPRAKSLEHRIATRRADRDGWHFDPLDIIDAHLPRPGYTEENFTKILDLFKTRYPDEDLTWMIDYKNKYLSL